MMVSAKRKSKAGEDSRAYKVGWGYSFKWGG